MDIKTAIEKLSKPIDIEDIDWRVQSLKKSKAGKVGMIVLGYKDARVDMNRLDFVLDGAWSPEYNRDSKGVLQCCISIYVQMPDETWQWVKKTSNGVESNTEKQKGEYSDAFKRAGFMLGIGRELYDLPFIWINLNDGEYYEANGKVRNKVNPNDWLWQRDEKGLLYCKDDKGNVRFKERPSQSKISKTNEYDKDDKVKKPTEKPKQQAQLKAVSNLDNLKKRLKTNKDKTLKQLNSQFFLNQNQLNELVKEKLVEKSEIKNVK